MLGNVPRWLWWLVWVLVGVLLVIGVAYLVHLAGGGLLNVHAGHFVFRLGVT